MNRVESIEELLLTEDGRINVYRREPLEDLKGKYSIAPAPGLNLIIGFCSGHLSSERAENLHQAVQAAFNPITHLLEHGGAIIQSLPLIVGENIGQLALPPTLREKLEEYRIIDRRGSAIRDEGLDLRQYGVGGGHIVHFVDQGASEIFDFLDDEYFLASRDVPTDRFYLALVTYVQSVFSKYPPSALTLSPRVAVRQYLIDVAYSNKVRRERNHVS